MQYTEITPNGDIIITSWWPETNWWNDKNGDYYEVYPEGNQTLIGGSGNDTLSTSHGDDLLEGGAGNDFLGGSHGQDTLQGNTGNDTLYGGNGFDEMRGGQGNDSLLGGDHGDTLMGDLGADMLFGEAHHDVLRGNQGNDTLDGGSGYDTLYGGQGRDLMTGGSEDDLFVFQHHFVGDDTISDFTDTRDHILLLRGITFEQLMVTQFGNNTVISVAEGLPGASLTLLGFSASNISADDFSYSGLLF